MTQGPGSYVDAVERLDPGLTKWSRPPMDGGTAGGSAGRRGLEGLGNTSHGGRRPTSPSRIHLVWGVVGEAYAKP